MNFCDSLLWTKHGSITSHPRRRNNQNNGSDELAPKKAKTVKVEKSWKDEMVTVFWDARGIIHIDYLPSKQPISAIITQSLLDCFKEKNVPI